jgi:hypothetical protein
MRRRTRPRGVRPGEALSVRIPADRLERLNAAARFAGVDVEALLQRWVLGALARETRHLFKVTEAFVTPLSADGTPLGERRRVTVEWVDLTGPAAPRPAMQVNERLIGRGIIGSNAPKRRQVPVGWVGP